MGKKFIVKICVLMCIVLLGFNSIYAVTDEEVMNQTKENYQKQEEENSNKLNKEYEEKKKQQEQQDALDEAVKQETIDGYNKYEEEMRNPSAQKDKSFLDKILGQGADFFNPSSTPSNENEIGNVINAKIAELGIMDAIWTVGNLVFVVITSVLGLKYIFASSPDKADIKNSLITLCVGVVFFFLAQFVYDFASGEMTSLFGGVRGINEGYINQYRYLEGKIWATIRTVINVCAILGIVLIGLKYMFASANTRADLKTELLPMLIGIMLVFSSINIINYIIRIGYTVLK